MTGRRLGAAVLLAAAPLAAGKWARIAAPLALAFPSDHGSHSAFRTEWWYITGQVTDAGGHRFGFQLTFFREGLDPSPPAPGSSGLRARQVLAAHLVVADIGEGKLRFAQRVRRIGVGLAGASEGDLDVYLEDWEIKRLPGDVITLAAHDRETAMALTLELRSEKPIVLQGEGGVSRKGPEPGNASAYLSFTRLAASGRLTLDGREAAVAGEAWFDHEWGSSQLGGGVGGWDWFGLRLVDGRELMLVRLRRLDGSATPESAGTLVERDGSTHHLTATDFTLEALAWWTSPHTGARYPSRFRLRVPAFALELEARALVADSELDARASAGTVYWEGPATVTGTVAGDGYVELTGYAGAMLMRF